MGLGPGKRARRRCCPGTSNRGQRCPGPHDAPVRPAGSRWQHRPSYSLSWWRQCRCPERGADLMQHNGDSAAVGSARHSTVYAQVFRRGVAVGIGALLVAMSAQVVVPVPLSPVPMTLQPLAVLVVGGLLGAGAGASALVLYIALGALGLPVFAGGGSGALHLVGPTGGYLLAFPVAAGLTGAVVGRAPRSVLRVLLASALGMVVIHVGG